MFTMRPPFPVDVHDVVDLDGALDQQDQAADKVVDEILRAESDADRQRAAEQRKRGQGDLDGVQREQRHKRQQGVIQDLLDGRGGVLLDLGALDRRPVRPPRDPPAGQDPEDQDQDRNANRLDGQAIEMIVIPVQFVFPDRPCKNANLARGPGILGACRILNAGP
jgi:hypothetical protein